MTKVFNLLQHSNNSYLLTTGQQQQRFGVKVWDVCVHLYLKRPVFTAEPLRLVSLVELVETYERWEDGDHFIKPITHPLSHPLSAHMCLSV